MRTVITAILSVLILSSGTAQQKVRHDSSAVAVREFSAENLSAYKSSRDFRYDKINELPKSLWDRLVQWIFAWISRIFAGIFNGGIITWVITILAAALIVFFVLKISGMTDGGLFGKKSAGKLAYSVNYEDIHVIDFEEAIQQAMEAKNFRLAVRLLYLQALKNLSDKGIINWQMNKTNQNYLAELSNTHHHPAFRQLTRHFENNWYGNMPVRESDFGQLKQLFFDFNKQL